MLGIYFNMAIVIEVVSLWNVEIVGTIVVTVTK